MHVMESDVFWLHKIDAAEALGAIGGAKGARELLRLMQSARCRGVRQAAVRAAPAFPCEDEAINALAERLVREEDDCVRIWMPRALAKIGSERCAEVLITALADSGDSFVRFWSAVALMEMRHAAACETLIDRLKNDPDSEVRWVCAGALTDLGCEQAAEALKLAMDGDSCEKIRHAAAGSFARLAGDSAVDAIVARITSTASWDADEAEWSEFARTGDRRLIEALVDRMLHGAHFPMRSTAAAALAHAADALREIGGRGAESALPGCFATEVSDRVVSAIVRALGAIGGRRAERLLIRTAQDRPDHEHLGNIVEALTSIGTAAPVDLLTEVMERKGGQGPVAELARKALWAIGQRTGAWIRPVRPGGSSRPRGASAALGAAGSLSGSRRVSASGSDRERMKMDVERHAVRAVWADEIERAIDSIKRTKFDKWMRREWHKAAARERWSEGRKARWMEWKRRRSHGTSRDDPRQPDRAPVTQSKVWVRGHVPPEFLDWAERHWSHDNETKAMLSECCFEAWEG